MSKVWVLMRSGNHTPSHLSFCNWPQFSYPNLLGRPHGFLLNNSQVEGTREDENQHCSWRGSWKREQSWVLHLLKEKQSGALQKRARGEEAAILSPAVQRARSVVIIHWKPWMSKHLFGSLVPEETLVTGRVFSKWWGCGGDVCMWAGEARTNGLSQGRVTLESRYQKESGWTVPKKCLLLSAQQSPAWRPGYRRQEGAN